MFVKCSNCGIEYDEYWMIPVHTGKKRQWLCWECYKEGQRQVHLEEKDRSKRIEKNLKYKKKSK